MCRVIALSNSKGGTGKTTTCMNLGIGLARKGYKVLLIDDDSQGSLTSCMGIQKKENLQVTTKSVLQKVLTGEDFDLHEGILRHEEGVELLPANGSLADLQLILQGRKNGELVMKQYVDMMRDKYHYILIDCPPSLSYITLNALCCADSVLIPMEAAFMSVMGLEEQLRTIFKIKRTLNPEIEIEGVLFTRTNERTLYSREIIALMKKSYGSNLRIFDTSIPTSVKIEECSALGISVFKHSPRVKAALAYQTLTEEVCG